MKRASVIGLLVALIIGAGACVGFATWSISVYGDYSMLSPSAYNDSLQEELDDHIWWEGGSGSVDKLSSTISFGADLWYVGDSSPTFGVGITRFSPTAGFSWEGPFGLRSLEIEDTTTVTGVLISGGYAWGGSSYRVTGALGGGYYWVNHKRDILVEELWFWDWYEYTAKKSQFGAHVLGKIEYPVADNIAVGLGFVYRWLTVSDMEVTEHDLPVWVDEPWWGPDLDLGGASFFVGVTVSG